MALIKIADPETFEHLPPSFTLKVESLPVLNSYMNYSVSIMYRFPFVFRENIFVLYLFTTITK